MEENEYILSNLEPAILGSQLGDLEKLKDMPELTKKANHIKENKKLVRESKSQKLTRSTNSYTDISANSIRSSKTNSS